MEIHWHNFTDLPILFTYCRTGSNRHLVTLAEQVSGLLPPMLKSTDGSSPWYKIIQHMIGLPCMGSRSRYGYLIAWLRQGSFLLFPAAAMKDAVVIHIFLHLKSPDVLGVGDGFTWRSGAETLTGELHSELPSRICTKDQVRKRTGVPACWWNFS